MIGNLHLFSLSPLLLENRPEQMSEKTDLCEVIRKLAPLFFSFLL